MHALGMAQALCVLQAASSSMPVAPEQMGRLLANCAAAKLQMGQPASALESCLQAIQVQHV